MILLGWTFNIAALKGILPGWVTVKPNTAIGFILCGVALALLRTETRTAWADRVGKVCAVAVTLLGAVTLAQYLLGINVGIDELLFRDAPDALLTSHPGRMAPVTALSFIFCGAALLLLDVSSRRGQRPAEFIILLPMALSFLGVLGYLYGSSSLYRVAAFTPIALPTALTILLFGLGLLLARPEAGWMAAFTNHGARGLLARRLIPAAIAGPVLIGWIRLVGEHMGLYGTEFGVAIGSLSTILIAVGMILWTAESLHQADLQRNQVESRLRDIEWLLTKPVQSDPQLPILGQQYGDLTLLNSTGEIMRSVGQPVLHDIVKDYLDLLDTSAAVYEKNGDYALGIFTSGWCRFMDERSRALCGTADNVEALNSGKWICHESCWSNHSRPSIETGAAVDSDCLGGLRIYAVPIRVGDEVIGSINFGYSDPPSDPARLQELAAKYQVRVEELETRRRNYSTRPPFIIELAKRRLHASARLIGEIVSRRRAEKALRLHATVLESAANAIVITNAAGVIEWVNPAFEKLTGYSSQDAVGRKTSLLKSGRTPAPVYENMWTTITAGGVWEGDITNRRRDGTLYEEHMMITPVRHETGGSATTSPLSRTSATGVGWRNNCAWRSAWSPSVVWPAASPTTSTTC